MSGSNQGFNSGSFGTASFDTPTAALTVVTLQQFRVDRPEFASVNDAIVTNYLLIAQAQLNPQVWCGLLAEGIELYCCHFLVIWKRNQIVNGQGTSGLALSKTLGRASVDYDTASVTVKNGGPFNLTSYGTQLLWWAQMVGAGPLQITGPMVSMDTTLGQDPNSVLGQIANTW